MHKRNNHETGQSDPHAAPSTLGRVLHDAARYDLLAQLLLLGREGPFREKLLDLAQLRAGEAVLDIGCGTGTLAIAARRRVGPAGRVHGIDASPEMIARAARKVARARADVTFEVAVVEAMPVPDASFDVVLSTLMLHHVPRLERPQLAREVRRVLRPGGRVLVVDFDASPERRKGILGHLHLHRHGHVRLDEINALLADAGLDVVATGPVGTKSLHFALATTRPDGAADVAATAVIDNAASDAIDASLGASLAHGALAGALWVAGLIALVVLAHAVLLFGIASRLAWPAAVALGVAALFVAVHLVGRGRRRGVIGRHLGD